MSQVEVQDMMRLVHTVNHFKGKYIKQILTMLEQQGELKPETRKIILDGFNGFSRSVLAQMGYELND
jgi:hypothetical protein